MDIDTDFSHASSWDEKMLERTRWLRENAPVYWSEKTGAFILSRYDDVVHVSKNHDEFCSGEGVLPGRMNAKIGMIDEDEPHHGEMRSLINRGFTPRMVRRWEEVFKRLTDETLDKIAAKGECDFVEDVAVPMPLILIAEMIGIRKEDRHRFHQWSDAMIGAQGNLDNPVITAAAGKAALEYYTYLVDIIADRRKSPKEDLISILVRAKEDGVLVQHDSDRHRYHMGAEPTDEQRANDSTATRDTSLRGVPIAKGQKVLMIYGSANRDAEAFENPDQLDIDRNPHHLAFGIGNHFCMGANLARMELRVALTEILRRLPDMRYAANGPELGSSALVRSVKHMHVRFTPERAD